MYYISLDGCMGADVLPQCATTMLTLFLTCLATLTPSLIRPRDNRPCHRRKFNTHLHGDPQTLSGPRLLRPRVSLYFTLLTKVQSRRATSNSI